ncbi:MAG: MFS transporter [Candidatus Bilamarchaeum sp.]
MFKIKRLELINIIYIFIYSALAIIVPLYLLERQIDLSSIGLILSLGPLIFLFSRVILAAFADSIGTKTVDLFYSISGLFSVVIYYFAASPLIFGLGNFTEGLRNAGFWAVIRTEAIEDETNNNQPLSSIFVYYSNLRQVGEGIGKIIAGLMLSIIGFAHSFELIFISSIALLIMNLTGKNSKTLISQKNKKEISVTSRILAPRSNLFWFSSLLQMLVWLPYNATSYFILPLYLHSSLGFSYEQTGLYLATYILGVGVVASLLRFLKVDIRKLYLLSGLIFIGYILMPLFGLNIIVPILLIAIGNGCSNIIAEYILSDQILRSKDVSTDIGLTYVPLKIVEFIFYLSGGLLIAVFGYWFLFIICALSIALFLILARKTILESMLNR